MISRIVIVKARVSELRAKIQGWYAISLALRNVNGYWNFVIVLYIVEREMAYDRNKRLDMYIIHIF